MDVSRIDGELVQLRGEMHISDGEEIRLALAAELAASSSTLVLRLSEVERCDTASLQLLFSLQKSAARDGKSFRIEAPSAAVSEASTSLGISLESLTTI